MIFTDTGIIAQFLSVLGVTVTTFDGYYVAFVVASAVVACVVISFMVLLFKFLCYIRKG